MFATPCVSNITCHVPAPKHQSVGALYVLKKVEKQQSQDSHEKIPSTGDGPIGGQGCLPYKTTESKCALCREKVCDICAVNSDMIIPTPRKCTEYGQENFEEHINAQEKNNINRTSQHLNISMFL